MDVEEGLTTQPEPEEIATHTTLREQLAENLTKITTEAATPSETEEQKAGRLANRERDEKGRVHGIKNSAGDTPSPSPAAPSLAAQTPPAEPKAPRPSSWKKDYWDDWEKLSAENPKLAAYLNQRESEFASGVSTYKHEWEQAKPLIDAIAPFTPILQQNGINPAEWISNLGNAHHRLVMGSPQDKIAMLQKITQEYGIPVQLAIQGKDGNYQLLGQQHMPQQPQFDPSMVERLVEKKLTETTMKQTLESFQREAPTKYPHFEAVKQTMAGLLQAGLANDLPSAYEAALRHPLHSDLFDAIQQQQREKQEAEQKAVQQQKVQRARSNAVSIPSSTPGGTVKATGEQGLRAQIAENLRAVAGGRV